MAKNTIESFGHSRFFCLLLQGKVSNLFTHKTTNWIGCFGSFTMLINVRATWLRAAANSLLPWS